MTLALFLNLRFYFDGRQYTADERYYQFWLSLTKYFNRIVFCVPVSPSNSARGQFRVPIETGRIEICPLPITSKMQAADLPCINEIISEHIHEWDVIGAVVPSIVGLLFLWRCRRLSKPCFAYVRGNTTKTAKYETHGFKGKVIYSLYVTLDWLTRWYMKRGLSFVVGQELHSLYKIGDNRIHKIVVSLISKGDLQLPAEDHDVLSVVDGKRQIRILYVGRLSSEKGVRFLMEACKILKEQYFVDFQLTVVGSGPDEQSLKELAINMGQADSVDFRGYIPFGSVLDKLFRRADVFVLPSLTEGLPKVILEAMSRSLPVVASRVGGIPDLIEHLSNGLLVPPADAAAIAEAVHLVAGDIALRKTLVLNARATMEGYTLEKQRDIVIDALKSHYGFHFHRYEDSNEP